MCSGLREERGASVSGARSGRYSCRSAGGGKRSRGAEVKSEASGGGMVEGEEGEDVVAERWVGKSMAMTLSVLQSRMGKKSRGCASGGIASAMQRVSIRRKSHRGFRPSQTSRRAGTAGSEGSCRTGRRSLPEVSVRALSGHLSVVLTNAPAVRIEVLRLNACKPGQPRGNRKQRPL